MGCTPSESFLASTLECFYDLSCISLIQQQNNYTNNINATYDPVLIFANASQFPMNTTMIDLVNHIFIESWSTTINYSAYFDQCSPTFCSYTYIQQLNSLYTVTFLLGLYGGLSFVLKWICPNVIYLLDKVYQWRKKRSNLVEPERAIKMATIENNSATLTSTVLLNPIVDSESVSAASALKYITFHFISIATYKFCS
jgi:hypothetical protein